MGDERLSFDEVFSDPKHTFEAVARKVEEEITRLDERLKAVSAAADSALESRGVFGAEAGPEELKAQLKNIDFEYHRLRTLLEAKKAVVHLSAAGDEHRMKVELANAMRAAAEAKADKDVANAEARYAVEVARAQAEREAVVKRSEADKRALASEHAANVLKAKIEANKVFAKELDAAKESLKVIADESTSGTLLKRLSGYVEEMEHLGAERPEGLGSPLGAEEPSRLDAEAIEDLHSARQKLAELRESYDRLQGEIDEKRKTERAYQQAIDDLLKAEERISELSDAKHRLLSEISQRQKAQTEQRDVLEKLLRAEERIIDLEATNKELQKGFAERNKVEEQYKILLENLLKAEERIAGLQRAKDQLRVEISGRQRSEEQYKTALENLLQAEERIMELEQANEGLRVKTGEGPPLAEPAEPIEPAFEPPAEEVEAPEREAEWYPRYKDLAPADKPAERVDYPANWFPKYQPEEGEELSCVFCSAPEPEYRESIGSYYCSFCGYVWRP